MKIKIHGARGSFPLYKTQNLEYGINTSCIEILTEKEKIILDAGTGIVNAFKDIKQNECIHIILSHYHMDHLSGLAFFKPLLSEDLTAHIYGPKYKNLSVKDVLNSFIGPPYFPLKLENFSSNILYKDLHADSTYLISSDITVKTIACNHSDLTLGYSLENKRKKISYITDTELGKKTDTKLQKFIDSSDLLIFDSTYTDNEYLGENGKMGWGHSTWQQAVNIAKASNIKKLLLFHHAPDRSDNELDNIQKEAQKIFPNVFVAKEGTEITL